MPPKAKTSTKVFIVLYTNEGAEGEGDHHYEPESIWATKAGADARVKELELAAEEDDSSCHAYVEDHDLKGGIITLSEEKLPKKNLATKEKPLKKEKPTPKSKAVKKEEEDDDDKEEEAEDEEEDEEEAAPKPAAKKTKTAAEQRATNAAKSSKSDDAELPENVKQLLDAMGKALDGKAIVVTGVPPTLGRKNAEKLVMNYGGKLTKSLSKNTSLVVIGNDAGPTKLQKINDLGIETLDEDAFIALIEAGGGGTKHTAEAEEKPKAKKAKK